LEERLKFHRVSLENCASADGLVVVIDVLRAFSTAAYAFAAGAEDIHLVSTVEQAFSLKGEIPDAKIMGEVDGQPVDGFDFGNSPPQFNGLNLRGVHLIQRTSSGTQGVVKSELADQRITTGFCTAGASIRFIQQMAPEKVTFLITGFRSGGWGDEDQACADFIEATLSQKILNHTCKGFGIQNQVDYSKIQKLLNFLLMISSIVWKSISLISSCRCRDLVIIC